MPADLQQALNNPGAPTLNVSSLGIQLTQQGSNDSPFLSANGKKVVFVGRNRPGHTQGQIYIYDLDTLKERRVTYQDGDCRDPIFLQDSKQIVYASTTDELKERPLLLRPKDSVSSYPYTELYLSDESGSNINRLTFEDGFDGRPWPRWDRPQSLTFSRVQNGHVASFQLNMESRQSIPVLAKKDISIESLQLSPDKKQWAWIQRADTGATLVWTGPYLLTPAKQAALTLPAGDYKDVQWMAAHSLLLTAKSLKKNYQFYTYDLETRCLQNLFESNTDLDSPRLNSEGHAVVFTSTQNGTSQIFYKTLSQPPVACLSYEGAPGTTSALPPPPTPPPPPRKKRSR